MTQSLEREVADPPPYWLATSPFYRLLRRVRLLNKSGQPRVLRLVATYTPLMGMGGAYDDLVRVRLIPVGRRALVSIWIAAIVPMLPLVATTMSIDKLLLDLGKGLLGGLPA